VLGAVIAIAAAVPQIGGAEIAQWAGNGHWYELVEAAVAWEDARFLAQTLQYGDGCTYGHLVTITSEGENDFIATALATGEPEFFAWIGGHEPNDDGVWVWGAGPEEGVQFSFYDAATPPDNYANWGGIEPNDFAQGEDYAAVNLGDEFAGILPGEWGDAPDPTPTDPIGGYIVEYAPDTPVEPRSWGVVKALFLGTPR
jgi:hypothetical protein